MDIIDLKRNLKSHDLKHSTIMKIIIKIQSIPEFQKLKMDVELTLLCCNLIENVVSKKQGFNKKDMVLDILQQIYNLNDEQKKIVENQIDFLFSNNKIKVIGKIKYLKKVLGSWIKKKVL